MDRFTTGVSCIPRSSLVYDETHHHSQPTRSLECWPSSNKVSPSNNWSILPLSTAQPTGEHGPPSVFRPYFFSPFYSRSLNGAASVLGLVSVFTAISRLTSSHHPFSCILIVFICLLCHQTRHYLPTTTYVHAEVFAFAAAARCLHHHSFHDNRNRNSATATATAPRSNIPNPPQPY